MGNSVNIKSILDLHISLKEPETLNLSQMKIIENIGF